MFFDGEIDKSIGNKQEGVWLYGSFKLSRYRVYQITRGCLILCGQHNFIGSK